MPERRHHLIRLLSIEEHSAFIITLILHKDYYQQFREKETDHEVN